MRLRTGFLLVVLGALLTEAGVLRAQVPSPLLVPLSELPAAKSVAVFGQKIVYYEAGGGPTLVLVHGFASQARFDWGRVIGPLATHHHVIALDQIGFGLSDKPFVDYSIQTYVDFLGEFLRSLHVEQFDLAGESLGGWVVANYSMQALAPANTGKYVMPKPRRLILEDAAGHTDPFAKMRLATPIALGGTLQSAGSVAIVFYDKSLVTEDFQRANFALKLAANDGTTQRLLTANAKLADETVDGRLGSITVPTLVVWGGNDEIVPLADGKDYAAKIPNAKLVVVPECGHAPSIEKPQAFVEAVEEFLK